MKRNRCNLLKRLAALLGALLIALAAAGCGSLGAGLAFGQQDYGYYDDVFNLGFRVRDGYWHKNYVFYRGNWYYRGFGSPYGDRYGFNEYYDDYYDWNDGYWY